LLLIYVCQYLNTTHTQQMDVSVTSNNITVQRMDDTVKITFERLI